MSGLKINKSFVPQAAVDKTIRRGIELWQHANDNKPCPPHVVEQIKKIVRTQATIMNVERGYGPNEARALNHIVRNA